MTATSAKVEELIARPIDNTFHIAGKPTRFKATHFLSVKGVPTVHGLTLNHRFRTTVPLHKVIASVSFMERAKTLCRQQAIIGECTDIAKHGAIVAPKYVHRLLAEHCTQAYNIKDWSKLGSQAHERAYYIAETNDLRVMVQGSSLLIYAGPEGRKACLEFMEKNDG